MTNDVTTERAEELITKMKVELKDTTIKLKAELINISLTNLPGPPIVMEIAVTLSSIKSLLKTAPHPLLREFLRELFLETINKVEE